uniref:PAP-associated domain-containing protein n=1 Tax=Steinernema glaseri TaxID=37863 RepID=A0A1I8A6D6_9BILA
MKGSGDKERHNRTEINEAALRRTATAEHFPASIVGCYSVLGIDDVYSVRKLLYCDLDRLIAFFFAALLHLPSHPVAKKMQPSASSPQIEKCEAMPGVRSKQKIQKAERGQSTSGISRLNERILLTYHWLQPRVCEYELRVKTFSRVSEVLLFSFRSMGIPVSTILYGSLATGLYLPESDIDIYLESPSYYAIDPVVVVSILRSTGMFHNIFICGKEERTCVKLVDTESNIRIDITFGAASALGAVEHVMDFKCRYGLLNIMVLILKYLINLKRLDRMNCPKGGISSYGLVLMVTNFLKGHRPPPASLPEFEEFTSLTGKNYEGVDISKVNLVELFSEFFDVYGNKLDLSKVALSANDGFVWKKELEESMGLSPASSIFTLQDPVKLDNDVGYNVYLMGQVVNVFSEFHRSIAELKESKDSDEQLLDCMLHRDLVLTQSAEDSIPREVDLNSDGDSSSDDSVVEEERPITNQIPIPMKCFLYEDVSLACFSMFALRIQATPASVFVDPCPVRCQVCIISTPTGGVLFYPYPMESRNSPMHNSSSSSISHSPSSSDVRRISPQTT